MIQRILIHQNKLYVCMNKCMTIINIAFSLQVMENHSITCWSNEHKWVLLVHKQKCFKSASYKTMTIILLSTLSQL
jgi:hypothetical protein